MRKKEEKAKAEGAELLTSLPALYANKEMLTALKGVSAEKKDEAIEAIKKVDQLLSTDPKLKKSRDLKEHIAQVFLPQALLIYPRAPECIFDTLKIATNLIPELTPDYLITILDQSLVHCLLLHGSKYPLIADSLGNVLKAEEGIEGVIHTSDIVVDNYPLIHQMRNIYKDFSDKATKDADPLAHKVASIRSIIESDDITRRFLLQGEHGGNNLVDLGLTLFDAATIFPLAMEFYPLRDALEAGIDSALALAAGFWKLATAPVIDAFTSEDYQRIFGSTPLVTRAVVTGESAGDFSAEIYKGVALPAEEPELCKVKINGDICKVSEGAEDPFDVTISPLKAGVLITPLCFLTSADEFQGYCHARVEDNYLIIGPSPIFTEIKTSIIKIPCSLEDGKVILNRDGDKIGIHKNLEDEPLLTISIEEAQNHEYDVETQNKNISILETKKHENVFCVEGEDLSDSLYYALELINAVTGSSILNHLDTIYILNNDGLFSSGFLPLSRTDRLPLYDIFIRDNDSPFLLACELVGLNRKRAFYSSTFHTDELFLSNSSKDITPGFDGFSESIEDLVGGSAIADFVCDGLRKNYITREQASMVVSRLTDLTVLEWQLRPYMTQSLSDYLQNFRAKVSALNEALKVENQDGEEAAIIEPTPIAQLVSMTNAAQASQMTSIFSTLSKNYLSLWAAKSRNWAGNKEITIREHSEHDHQKLSEKLYDCSELSTSLAVSSIFERSGADVLDHKVRIIKELVEEVQALFEKLEQRRLAKPEKNDWDDPFAKVKESLKHQISLIFDVEGDEVEDHGLSDAYDESEIEERQSTAKFSSGEDILDSFWDQLSDLVIKDDRDGFIERATRIAERLRIDPDLLYLDDDFTQLRSEVPEIAKDSETLKAEIKKNQIMLFLGYFFPEKTLQAYDSALSYVIEIGTSHHYEEGDVCEELSKILISMASNLNLDLGRIFNNIESEKPEKLSVGNFYTHVTSARLLINDPVERYVAVINRVLNSLPSKFLLAFASRIFQTEPEKLIDIIKQFGIREDDVRGLQLTSVDTDLLSIEIAPEDEEKSLSEISSDISTSPFEFLDNRLKQIRAYLEIRPKGENTIFDHSLLSMLPIIVLEQSLKGQIGVEICKNGFESLSTGLSHPEIYGDNATKEFLKSIATETIRAFFQAESLSESETVGDDDAIKDIKDKKEQLAKFGVVTTSNGLRHAMRAIGFYETHAASLPPTTTFEELLRMSGKALGPAQSSTQ